MTDNRNGDGKVLKLVMTIRMVLNKMTMIWTMARVNDVDDTEKNNEDTKDNGDEVADDADIGEK
jgi:hypothetical protein